MRTGFFLSGICAGMLLAIASPGIAEEKSDASADPKPARKDLWLPSFLVSSNGAESKSEPKDPNEAPLIADLEDSSAPKPDSDLKTGLIPETGRKESEPFARVVPAGEKAPVSKMTLEKEKPVAVVRRIESDRVEKSANENLEPFARVAEAPLTLDEIRRRLAEKEDVTHAAADPPAEPDSEKNTGNRFFGLFKNRKASESGSDEAE